MKNMIGYCGLDCEKCDAYLAAVNNDQALREKTAKLWAELNNAPILPEHINCEGCRVNGAKTVFCEHMLSLIHICAGKTTLFNCLNRDLKADSGNFYIEDENGVRREVAAAVSYTHLDVYKRQLFHRGDEARSKTRKDL